MPVNLGLDGFIAAVSKRHASGYRKRVEDVLEAAAKSDRNQFQQGAVITSAQIKPLAAGVIVEYAGATVPTGFLECNGAEVPRANFVDLHAAIGDIYGTAQAATHFKLPDLAGASVTGAGGTRSAGPGIAVGDTHDSDTVTLTTANLPRHAHAVSAESAEAGAHGHGWTRIAGFAFNAGGRREGNPGRDSRFGVPGISVGQVTAGAGTLAAGSHTHTIDGDIEDTGEGTAISVQQPSLAVMMLIKT